MPKPFLKLNLGEFEELVATFAFSRSVDAIHMHHTWRPNHHQYTGLPSIEAMWRHHTQTNRWSDIAQHISIGPDGSIWTGRNWNAPPASAAGYNGNTSRGPFMFEMIGDFDAGKDPFQDPQRSSVIRVIATLLKRFSLPVSALRFHNHMTDEKSCPGTGINYNSFCEEVEKELRSHPAIPKSGTKHRSPASAVVEEARRMMEGLVEVDLAAPEYLADHLHAPEEVFSRRPLSVNGVALAEAHLINLTDGQLSSGGYATTSEESLETLFKVHLAAELVKAREEDRPLRIMFFAHGGLNDEKGAVVTALGRVSWWMRNGVYPIFFVWETGLLETFGQMLKRKMDELWGSLGSPAGSRGVGDFIADKITDPAVERAARSIGGVAVWGAMKNSAARAALPNSGGSWLTARHLKEFLKSAKEHPVELHAIGHSAGGIFHAHFLAALRSVLGANGPSIKTLHHLAPAVRVDLFKEKVLPLLGKGIDRLTLYTMNDRVEREDICMNVYRKSLLYLIHHALEPEARCPLVGLERSVRADRELLDLFEPAEAGLAEVIWSPEKGGPRHSSSSRSHGDFDEDADTMNSVCRRIVDKNDIVEYDVQSRSVFEGIERDPTNEEIALGLLASRSRQGKVNKSTNPGPDSGEVAPRPLSPGIFIPSGGHRQALCLGINEYPLEGDRLFGCVNDASRWADFFTRNNFDTQVLLDEKASYDAILDSFGRLVKDAKPGDVVAIQYSGHGTQLQDQNGDEEDDWMDEALCNHDFRSGKVILDDDLADLFAKLKDGVNFTLLMDCCHSGTNNRTILGRVVQEVPGGALARKVHAGAELNELHAAFQATKGTSRNVGSAHKDIYKDAKDLLFAAALPAQSAYEIAGSGVFTTASMRYLKSNGGRGISNADFAAAVLASVPKGFKDIQEPRIYGSEPVKNRPFLGGL